MNRDIGRKPAWQILPEEDIHWMDRQRSFLMQIFYGGTGRVVPRLAGRDEATKALNVALADYERSLPR